MSLKGFLKAEQEFFEQKSRVAEYYRANRVPQTVEELLNQLFVEKPVDIYGYMANYFSRLAHAPVISSIKGREVFDSQGDAALQVDIYCVVRNEEKLVCSSVITGVDDKGVESRDAVVDGINQQASCAMALEWLREQLSSMLCGFNPIHQTKLDKVLSDFLMARFLEQEACNRETEEEEKTEGTHETTPPLIPSKDKKGGDKGKKRNSVEKLVPPPEIPVPVLPGAMVVAAVSLAAAKCAASLTAVPLYKHIITLRDPEVLSSVFMPVPLLTVLSCGKASAGKLNLLEELILLPTKTSSTIEIVRMGRELHREMRRMINSLIGKTGPAVLGVSEGGALQLSFERSEQALDLLMDACTNLGLPIGIEVQLAINCAAHRLMDYPKGKYEVMAGTLKSPDELVDMYVGLVSKYPAVKALIDPFRKEDVDQWLKLSSLIGRSCCLITDSAVTMSPCWRDAKPLPPGVTLATFRLSSEMTLTDLLQTISHRRAEETILLVRGEEIGDDAMVDVAVGVGVTFIKMGGLNGAGRMNKYNRLQSIEQELQDQGILGVRGLKLPWEPEKAELNCS
ncbi:enolase 4 isoform X2 [Hoplias malabaricus]|uniref:enolase 4 isoform X2 n=1 Tax=Hoplias malabaricus TaxID=27720 RepID=UPI0034618BD5